MLSEPECALNLEQEHGTKTNVPPRLSFEEIVKNYTLPPCSLNDFMDYLVYEERNAECLQFFLWYCDYIERWSQLLPRQKSLSPPWNQESDRSSRSSISVHSHKRTQSEKLTRILTILEVASAKNNNADMPERRSRRSNSTTTNFSLPRTPGSETASIAGSDGWQPFTIQPFRDEMSRVVRHYIAESGPRQLKLSHIDRTTCLAAAQITTHPSALLPAFTTAEAQLRSESHPKFIRWCRNNATKVRLTYTRCIGILLVVLGFGLDIFFTLSRLSHFYRIVCLALWWPGFSVFIAAFQGICVFLHTRNLRNLRPWEQFGDLEHSNDDGNDSTGEPRKSVSSEKGSSYHGHSRNASTLSRVDPLRKPSMQTFGPSNDFQNEPWVKHYANGTLLYKIFDGTTKIGNHHIQLMQDRVVFLAVCWGGLIATALTVTSLFIPSAKLFL